MSKNIKGEMILIGCGGAGTSIVGNLVKHLHELGSGFANVSVEYIDTSDANVKNFDHTEDNFSLVKSMNIGENISGSGSVRAENAAHIIEFARNFVNEKGYDKNDLAKYYVVIASASGGSGSVIAPMVVSNLLAKELNVITILVGDSSDKKGTTNTLNTLATMNNIANDLEKPLSLIYFDNNKEVGATIKERLANVDKQIFKHLASLGTFLSGDVLALDQKDMSVFLDISLLDDEVLPGLYALEYFSGTIKLAPHHKLRVVRTITIEDVSPDLNLPENVMVDHHKFGVTVNENVIEKYSNQFPMHYVSYANRFSTIEMELKSKIDNNNNDSANATVDNVTGTSKAKKLKHGLVV